MHQPANLEQARFKMIEQQIRPWDVLDPTVLELLSAVRREDFVPLAHKALAFMDMEVPLPGGECMLAPRVEARLLQDLKVQPHEKVLEVGGGSGYMAALLAHRAQRGHDVGLDGHFSTPRADNSAMKRADMAFCASGIRSMADRMNGFAGIWRGPPANGT